ncbi:MAG: GIDE domain-containing protein [Gammaproteobacteria bacterium]
MLDAPLRQTVLEASTTDFWIGITVAAVLAAGGFVLAFHFFHRSRLIEDVATSRIRSAAQGFVELEGIAETLKGEPILSPLSGEECAWYRYRVEKYTRGSRNRRWRTVDRGVSDAIFLLRDGTGICVVDPEGARVIPHQKRVWYGDSPRPSRVPETTSWWTLHLGGREYRYTEERLLPGFPLYAMGQFRTVGGANETFNTREEVRELLASWKGDPKALKERFDRNGDGEIDLDEWERARGMALAEVRQRQRERASQPGVHTLSKPADNHPFLLSGKSQEELTARFRWYAVAGLVAFFLVGGGAVWALALRFA